MMILLRFTFTLLIERGYLRVGWRKGDEGFCEKGEIGLKYRLLLIDYIIYAAIAKQVNDNLSLARRKAVEFLKNEHAKVTVALASFSF